jgi:hypothetical protein
LYRNGSLEVRYVPPALAGAARYLSILYTYCYKVIVLKQLSPVASGLADRAIILVDHALCISGTQLAKPWLEADSYLSEGGLARLIGSGFKKGCVLVYCTSIEL